MQLIVAIESDNELARADVLGENVLKLADDTRIVKGARDIVEAGQNLIDRANENGGNDNISVVLAEPFSDEVSIW